MFAIRLWLAIGLAVWVSGCGSSSAPSQTAASTDLTSKVNPFVGTDAGFADFGTGGGAGNTYPGAVRPFGMLQFSPDTYPSTINYAGGYTYSDTVIKGFSLTHISGAGCGLYQDVSIMPTMRAVKASPVRLLTANLNAEFRADFDHDHERAEPGYYQVTLNPLSDQAIQVELTAAPRAGMMRITFPAAERAQLLINAGSSFMANNASRVQIDPAQGLVTGSATSGRFCYQDNRYTVYYAIEFDQPIVAHATWQKLIFKPGSTQTRDTALLPISYTPIPGGPGSLPGDPSGAAQAGAVLSFDTRNAQTVNARVAISFVSVDNALKNLRAEVPDWNFDALQRAASQDWQRELSRIQISGGSETDQRKFYTALYHSMVAPNIFSDVNGDYLGFDGQVHHLEAGDVRYHNFSGWDIYRSQIPLLSILDPVRSSAIVRSFIADAQESGDFLPKWSIANQHTNVMVGDPADPIIASSYAFGARDFDHAEALRLMLRGARVYGSSSNPNVVFGYLQRPGLIEYKTFGYIPFEGNVPTGAVSVASPAPVWGTSATTLEYASADFSIAAFASALGLGEQAQDVCARADNWRALLNPASGFLEPRLLVGFNPLFDPASDLGYVEGSGAQYSWMVPHNVGGLIEARGGTAKVIDLLDTHYAEINAGPKSVHAFLGNEPGLSTPWIYAWLGQPWKTQALVHRALNELYDDAPGGMPGNDDLGTMSAWWVLAALGLNPAIPGTDVLTLNTPLFPQARVRRDGGDWVIQRIGDGDYIASAELGETPLDRAWLHYAETAGATSLRYRASEQPQPWAATTTPPSYSAASVQGCAASLVATAHR